MRMPYIGGRGPDYTTKLNLMYNWSGEWRVGGVAGDDSSTSRRQGWGGWETLRRGWLGTVDGRSLTRAMSVEDCAPRRKWGGWRGSRTSTQGSQKGHPPVRYLGESHQKGHIDINTRNNPDASSVCKFAEEGRHPSQNEGWPLEARGNRSPPRSESL